MPALARLGGFKILRDVTRIAFVLSDETRHSPARFFRIIDDEKINLPYVICIRDWKSWGLNMMVDAGDESRVAELAEASFGKKSAIIPKSAVLSIFPHRKDPKITGSLFETFYQEGLKPYSFAMSPAALSVVLREDDLGRASEALFEPFSFSAYRTPADWKLVQRGKEQLYKEVVASYQEQRPKVYGLEYHDGQEFLYLNSNSGNIGQIGAVFKEFAIMGLNLTFLATSPGGKS